MSKATKRDPNQPFEKGDRFRSTDSRDEGRIVEIYDVLQPGLKYAIRAEVNAGNPSAVGHETVVSHATLNKYYRRISR